MPGTELVSGSQLGRCVELQIVIDGTGHTESEFGVTPAGLPVDRIELHNSVFRFGSGCDKKSGDAVPDDLRPGTTRTGDDRSSAGEGLGKHETEWFVPLDRDQQSRGTAEQQVLLNVVNGTDVRHPVAVDVRANMSLPILCGLRVCGMISRDHEWSPSGTRHRDCLSRAFHFFDAAEEHQRRIGSNLGLEHEPVQVDAVVNRVPASPGCTPKPRDEFAHPDIDQTVSAEPGSPAHLSLGWPAMVGLYYRNSELRKREGICESTRTVYQIGLEAPGRSKQGECVAERVPSRLRVFPRPREKPVYSRTGIGACDQPHLMPAPAEFLDPQVHQSLDPAVAARRHRKFRIGREKNPQGAQWDSLQRIKCRPERTVFVGAWRSGASFQQSYSTWVKGPTPKRIPSSLCDTVDGPQRLGTMHSASHRCACARRVRVMGKRVDGMIES